MSESDLSYDTVTPSTTDDEEIQQVGTQLILLGVHHNLHVYQFIPNEVGDIQRESALRVVNWRGEHTAEAARRLQNDYCVASHLDHENIACWYHLQDHTNPQSYQVSYMILAHAHYQLSLRKAVASWQTPSPLRLRKWLCGVANALNYLHETKRVVHRQVAIDNIKIDENDNAILCNFELARFLNENEHSEEESSTPKNYLDSGNLLPEIAYNIIIIGNVNTKNELVTDEITSEVSLSPEQYCAADVLAFGEAMFEIIFGRPFNQVPFSQQIPSKENTQKQIYWQRIWKNDFDIAQKLRQYESLVTYRFVESLKELLQGTLTANVQERLNSRQVAHHSWFELKY